MFEKYFMAKAMERLQNGKTASLSPAQIAELNLDMEKAKSNLPPEQFYMVLDLFKEYKAKTYKITYELKGYEKAVVDMFFDFDFLGNVKCYAKDSKISAFWVENEDKEHFRNRAYELRAEIKRTKNILNQFQTFYDKFKDYDLNELQKGIDNGTLPKDETEVVISSMHTSPMMIDMLSRSLKDSEERFNRVKNNFDATNQQYNAI